MSTSTLFRMLVVATVTVSAGGCERIHEPWDQTGYFQEERERAAAREAELRQRARQQADRAYGIG